MRNLHLIFDYSTYVQSNVRWRFRKSLWPSQNLWTLPICKSCTYLIPSPFARNLWTLSWQFFEDNSILWQSIFTDIYTSFDTKMMPLKLFSNPMSPLRVTSWLTYRSQECCSWTRISQDFQYILSTFESRKQKVTFDNRLKSIVKDPSYVESSLYN